MKRIITIVSAFSILLISIIVYFLLSNNKTNNLDKVTVADTTLTSRIYIISRISR